MKVVYIAGPYSAPTYLAREQNILNAKAVAAALAYKGIGFFCPHLNSAHFDEAVGKVLGHEFWLELDLRLMQSCDALYLMHGWEHSRGAQVERTEAHHLGIPVFVDLGEAFDWAQEQE